MYQYQSSGRYGREADHQLGYLNLEREFRFRDDVCASALSLHLAFCWLV